MYDPAKRHVPYDTDAHLRTHPFAAWVGRSFQIGWERGAGNCWSSPNKKDVREAKLAILPSVAAEVVKWLATLPLGIEITSPALAKAIAPCPDSVDDEEQWYHVLCNRLGDMRYFGMLDGYWRDEPNRRRAKQPHKRYFNGIPA